MLGPRRLHPLSPFLDLGVFARQLLVPVVIVGLSGGALGLFALVFLAALFVGWRVLAWSRRWYRVEDGTLRIDEGVLRRDTREIPLTRIQQVDLRRQIRHRLFGLVAVRIDTAGGGSGAEAVLDAMTDADALELRSALLDPRHRSDATAARPASTRVPVAGSATATGPAPYPGAGPFAGGGSQPSTPVVGEVLVRLSTRDLGLAGVTGSGLLAGLSILGFAFLVFDVLPEDTGDDVSGLLAELAGMAVVVALVLAVLVPIWLAVAAAASVIRDHDFTLTRYGSDLHVTRGLFDQREATLALHRIQAAWVLENPLRRRLGVVAVQLQSAGSGTDPTGDVTRLTVPLVRRDDLADFLAAVVPGGGGLPELVAAPPAARRRARVRAGAVAVAIVGLVALVSRTPLALGAVVAFLPAMWFADRAYRALGHALTAETLVARWGALLRRTVVVPLAKTQSSRLRSTPFQRRVRLATLLVQVAGRGPTVEVIDGDQDRLRALRAQVLVAPGALLDERAVRRRTLAGLEAAVAR